MILHILTSCELPVAGPSNGILRNHAEKSYDQEKSEEIM